MNAKMQNKIVRTVYMLLMIAPFHVLCYGFGEVEAYLSLFEQMMAKFGLEITF
jgi:hypothetical protein